MKFAVNSEEMKQIDQNTVDQIKIPALVLMERAALEVTSVMKRSIQKQDRILAICGAGNNGGDGIAAGRILYLQGYQVAILFIGEEARATKQTLLQLEIAKNLGIPMENNNKLSEYNIVIDAIFGVGLSRPVSGKYAEIINRLNALREASLETHKKKMQVFAVDIPSGISADTGLVMNTAIRADHTVTFGFQKLGLILYPGAEYAGAITVADIGFPGVSQKAVQPRTFYYENEDIKRIPKRSNYSNKGTYGKVLIIGGSKGMSGAPYLSAKAAYKMGSGLVKILTSYENRDILQTSLPEALYAAYDDMGHDHEERMKAVIDCLAWASVIVIGPGLGQSVTARELLLGVIREAKVPCIIDADGLNILAKEMDAKGIAGMHRLEYLSELLKEGTVLTPHMMELSRLIGVPVNEITNNLIDTASSCSYNNELIYVMKDARTVVSCQKQLYLNVSGNHGMATGGSGDVLTGMIAALIAQGMGPYAAACLGVYLHGAAGDAAAEKTGTYSMMAGDIVNAIEDVIRQNTA